MVPQGSDVGEYHHPFVFFLYYSFNSYRHVLQGRKLGFRLSVLAIIIGVVWATGTVPDLPNSGCVTCHQPHNEARGTCTDCHRGNPRSARIQIAHYRLIGAKYAHFNLPESPVLKDGHRLIITFACRRCHRTAREGNTLAANLDLSLKNNLPQALADTIQNPVAFMPNFYFLESDIIKLVNTLLDSSAALESEHLQSPQRIHFEEGKNNSDNPFAKHCGACHRVLSKQFGGLGQGNTGPNLSGLLTRFYPQNYPAEMPWTPSGLKRWLENPRDLRATTQMPPVALKDGEFTHILNSLEYRP